MISARYWFPKCKRRLLCPFPSSRYLPLISSFENKVYSRDIRLVYRDKFKLLQLQLNGRFIGLDFKEMLKLNKPEVTSLTSFCMCISRTKEDCSPAKHSLSPSINQSLKKKNLHPTRALRNSGTRNFSFNIPNRSSSSEVGGRLCKEFWLRSITPAPD